MNKFKKLVELAKVSIEATFLNYDFGSDCQFLPKDADCAIFILGDDWYYTILTRAGYSHKTVERKVNNMDFDKLASALDDWYKTEMYPKVLKNYDYREVYSKEDIRYFK